MNYPPVRTGCYYGGTSIEKDLAELADPTQSPHIIVGTPGRLVDLAMRGFINLRTIRTFVIDECDTLISKRDGSILEINLLRDKLHGNTQHILVSATFTPEARQQCQMMCQNKLVEVSADDGSLDLTELAQFYEVVAENNKFHLLEQILDGTPFNQAIIFTNTVRKARLLTQLLQDILFNPITIHSDLSQ